MGMLQTDPLRIARRQLIALEVEQSQASLTEQAEDCIPIVEALGYYDLGDLLRTLVRENEL